jgi:hypothetical protein
MLLDDLLTSAKQTLVERLASPLLGSFAVAWCAWNYKFLVILFSSASVSQTFDLIEKIAFPDAWSIFARGIFYPLASASVYVFLYPYPARYIYEFTLKRQREINQTKQRIADETPLTREESRRLRAEFVQRERTHAGQVQELTNEITRLNAALDSKQALASPPELSPAERLYDRLEPSQFRLLQAVEELGSPVSESELVSTSKEKRVKTEYDIGELVRRRLLRRNSDGDGYSLDFTHDGRRALLDGKKD